MPHNAVKHLKLPHDAVNLMQKNHNCTVARCRPLCSYREKNLLYNSAKMSSQSRSQCKTISCVYSPQRVTEKGPLIMTNGTHVICGLNSNGLLYSTQADQDSHRRAIQDVC
ncbi:hypothetical protein TNCV_546561 [Trichonephila clavipes]|nr:hypothetical protein TNCV_546561 [Trichonephila clavipes]